MIGSLLNRGLVLIFGYAYPAYECFKTVEKNKPEIEQLRFWCQYWILVAMLTVCERIGDSFISWLPMYSEAKLAFYIYLWYPKTKGTSYVYDCFFKPYVAKHETEIDRNLVELKTKAGDMAYIYFQKAANYGQTRVFEILQYVASQSTPTPKPCENQNPRAAHHAPATARDEEPPSSQQQREVSSSAAPLAIAPSPSARKLMSAGPANSTSTVKKISQQPNSETESSSQSATDETQEEDTPPPQETAMEEAIHVTGARLRKTRSTTEQGK